MNLARLAVDVSQQGQGLGGQLIVDALRRIQRFADEIGIRAVTVDAVDAVPSVAEFLRQKNKRTEK